MMQILVSFLNPESNVIMCPVASHTREVKYLIQLALHCHDCLEIIIQCHSVMRTVEDAAPIHDEVPGTALCADTSDM